MASAFGDSWSVPWGETIGNVKSGINALQNFQKKKDVDRGGMFNAPSQATMWQAPSGYVASTQPQQYDISNLTGGMGMLKTPGYQASKVTPYKFGGIGNYGKSSAADVSGMYNQAMNVATAPVMAQGQERMRQATQGWGGNQMSSAANKELAMKNAQATGQQLAEVGKGIGSDLAGRMLTQEETARQQDFQQKKDLQTNQAAENFKAAGYNDSSARFAADDINRRATGLMQGGAGLLDFQRKVVGEQAGLFNNVNFADYM